MANSWLDQIWPAVLGPARMARRKVTAVLKHSSQAELEAEVRARGFHLAKVGPQYVVFRYSIDVKC